MKRVRTATGEVRARTVVIACGAYIGGLLRQLQWATVPIATFVAVTEPLGPELDAAIATRHAVSDLQFATNYYRRLDGGPAAVGRTDQGLGTRSRRGSPAISIAT